MNYYHQINNCRTSQQSHQTRAPSKHKAYFNAQNNNNNAYKGNNINTNTSYLNHNNKKMQHSFKFEHITDAKFLSYNKNNTNQYCSNRLFLGNHASTSIKLHFQKKYRPRHYKHPNGGIPIPEDLYKEIISLQSQMLNLLKYECSNIMNMNNNNKNKKHVIDIHIVYLQNIECLGILIYYEHNNNNALSIFNKYFTIIEYIDNQCNKYWECIKCQYQFNKIKHIKESIFFCEKCKFDFTFHHNPNNHFCVSFDKQYNSNTNNNNNIKVRSCIKYKFLLFNQFNANNINTMNLYGEMSHEEFQQLSNTKKYEIEEIENKQNENINNNNNVSTRDWTDELLLSNLENWFGHKSGTKIGLNDYKFDIGNTETFEDSMNNIRCRDSEGERHGVDHNCNACKPWLINEEWEYNNHSHGNNLNYNNHHKQSWLCSLCQKTIPIDIKTCICVTYDNRNNKNQQNSHKNVSNVSSNTKDCLILIKELAETLHSTISFTEIRQEFKTSSKPFEYEIRFNGEIIANGYGNSKRKAQRNGAEIALDFLSKDKGYLRKINLLQKFGRIGHCEIDRNLYIEICRDISDENDIYFILPANCIEYLNTNTNTNLFEYENQNIIINYLENKIINDSPEIVAYKTRVEQISQLDEPSVLGCLDVTGPLKFSLVSGIFHKDVNNGRYGYNYNPKYQRNKKKKKRKKRRRNNNNNNVNTNDKSVSTVNNNNKYSNYDELYNCNQNEKFYPKYSKRRRRKKEREKKENNMHGVYICHECDKYYADHLNGKYLYESKWFCFNCIKKINERNYNNNLNSFMESAIYTKRIIENDGNNKKNNKNNNNNELTPPMTPPSSDDESNNNMNKNYYKNEEEFMTEIMDNLSLFGPHTPSSPSFSENKIGMKKIELENNNNDSGNEIIQQNVSTVSVATQVNCNNNSVNKAIQVTTEEKDNETKSSSPVQQFNNYDSIPPQIYNHNEKNNLKIQYQDKYINNIRINDDNNNYQQPYPRPHPHQQHQHHPHPQILYNPHAATYNIQNGWETYYGQPHKNMLFIDPYQSINDHTHNTNTKNTHSHSHNRHTYHTHTQIQTTTTTNRHHHHTHAVGIDQYHTFQCSAYSNMKYM